MVESSACLLSKVSSSSTFRGERIKMSFSSFFPEIHVTHLPIFLLYSFEIRSFDFRHNKSVAFGRKQVNVIRFSLFSSLSFHRNSWGSGANPWGPEKEDQYQKPTHYDGKLEVVGVHGVVHMGQIQSGLRTATRIAQGGSVSTLSYFICRIDHSCCWQTVSPLTLTRCYRLRSRLTQTCLSKWTASPGSSHPAKSSS